MADTQLTILGMSGSGKTCFLLGLYYKMGPGLRGFTIGTDDDTDVDLRDRYKKLCDITLSAEERFPAGTDSEIRYAFDLQYGFDPIMSFDWVDYPGGLLDRKNTGDLNAFESIDRQIMDSSSLFICVDGSLLKGNDIDEKIDKVRDNCSNVINTYFSKYLKENDRTLPPTAIIITKYDVCMHDTDKEELKEIIQEAFSPFFTTNDVKKFVTIIPISIGTNIMEDNYSGRMKPLNIHLPIFMGIYFALNKTIEQLSESIDSCKQKTSKEVAGYETKKTEESNKWWLTRNDARIHELSLKIEEARKKGNKEAERLSKLVAIQTKNSQKLLDELEQKIPFIFIDGEPGTFADLLRD